MIIKPFNASSQRTSCTNRRLFSILPSRAFEQGREQGGREFLLDVLALRFQPEDVQRLASRIEAIGDVQRLKQLHRAAIQVPSLEAFRHLLDAEE